MVIARVLLLAAVAPLGLYAQTAPQQAVPAVTKPLVFEVASVRRSKSAQGYGVQFTPDGIVARSAPLKSIIRAAYNETRNQVWFGAPAWLDSATFDIEAKFDPEEFKAVTDEQRRAMLQKLLADRFKLVVRPETKELPEYALEVAKGGPRLRVANVDTMMRDENNLLYCRAGLTNFRQCTMPEFAHFAPMLLPIDRLVVDRTGLTGRYDFELIYSMPFASAASSSDASPDIYGAFQDQIGLRLVPITEPVKCFVIDHVEMPSEN